MSDSDEITVNAWSERFSAAVKSLLKTEGGFVNHPKDPGGATKFGISLRFLLAEGKVDRDGDGHADFDLDMDGDIDVADIRALTEADAKMLYDHCFWRRLNCESLPRPIGEMVFDQAVNGGSKAAIKILQRAINFAGQPGDAIGVDGDFGQLSRDAMWRVIRNPSKGMPALVVAFREMAKARYRSLVRANPDLGVFLNGWLRRASELGRDV